MKSLINHEAKTITYYDDDGSFYEVPLSDQLLEELENLDREEFNSTRKQHRHCVLTGSFTFEGLPLSAPDIADDAVANILAEAILSRLTPHQKRYVQLRAAGYTFREIAEIEGKNPKTIWEAVQAAKKKNKNSE